MTGEVERRLRRAAFSALIALVTLGSVDALGVVAPDTAVPGGTVTVYIPANPAIRSAKVGLYDSAGAAVAVMPAFPFTEDPLASGWVAILGVPTTIRPGSYRIEVRVTGESAIERQSLPIAIAPREFRHENIHLDQGLTRLQTEKTPVKRAQAVQLWGILMRFDGAAIYQTGRLTMPVEGYVVTSHFGDRRDYVFTGGGEEPDIHQGIDFGVPAGTPIHAAGAGRVTFAGSWLMTGNTVIIEQLPGVYALYYHMDRMLVHEDQLVKQGDPIGFVGSTGLATGPHLHWQIEVGGVAVDPMALLSTALIKPSDFLQAPN